nr:immunoglobulin light chain junction region [Macaca mulatta]
DYYCSSHGGSNTYVLF